MYDTVKLILETEQVPNINLIEEIPQYLTRVTKETNHEIYGYSVQGYLKNLFVNISENRIVIQNSLVKYWYDDNFKTLTKGIVKKIIREISNTLHLPIHEAKVIRIDLATNIILKQPVELYLEYLGETKYYKRLKQPNGITYSTKKRQLLFYDKVKEQREKKQVIDTLYKYSNVLRIELRYTERINKQFNRTVLAKTLYDETFYVELVKKWKDEYLSVQKLHKELDPIPPTGNTKELGLFLTLQSVLAMGQHNILHDIKVWQKTNLITNLQAQRLRDYIKGLNKDVSKSKGNELIVELDEKVRQVYRVW